MPKQQNIALKLSVLTPQGNFLGGTVDIELKRPRGTRVIEIHEADASREITVNRQPGLSKGDYQLTVTPTGAPAAEPQIVSIPATGVVTATVVIDHPSEPEPKRASALMLGASGDDSFVVKGQARGLEDSGLANVTIQAFDRDLRREAKLGEAQINNGHYEIRYSSEQLLRAEKGAADLVVKAFASDGKLLAASPTLFNAPPVAEIDLSIPPEAWQPAALFEKIRQAVEPSLNDVKIEELEEDDKHQDLSFLAGETGFEKSVLARFALAHRLGRQAIESEFWFALLGGSFFKYAEDQSLESQLTAILNSLPSLDATAARKALIRSFNLKEIPDSFQEKTSAWVEAFLELAAGRVVIDSDEPTFVKSALRHAGIESIEKQKAFARLYNQYRAITPELLDTLRQDEGFNEAEIADLRVTFQLGDLTRADFSVVKMIKDEFDIRRPEELRALAKLSQDEWVNLVREKHDAGAISIPFESMNIAGQRRSSDESFMAEAFGKSLERRFREAFPTAAFTGGLERALSNGGAHGLNHAQALKEFLTLHEEFELLNTPVDEFLNNGVDPGFRELADNKEFRLEIKAAQRVFKLVPTFEATDALLADGLHSAQQIYQMGESEFVRRYGDRAGFTPETARLAWNRAADTHAAVLTIVADLKALEAGGLPLALNSGGNDLSSFPNWDNLFQTGDFCDCDHCRSVLGPAAYFADLLMFLGKRNSTVPGQTVKDVLFKRRPDLGYLELNCDNALTTLPYIDVVCEVLEDVVAAGGNDLEIGLASIPADSAAAKAAVAAAFEAKEISLGANFSISQVGTTDSWVVHGEAVTYLLKKKGASTNYFAEILRNTKAGAAELRAYPQYVNPVAYEKLRQARYPFALPFDLFAEEARAAFQKIGVRRWELMRTLRGAAAPNNPTDGEIASEYFGISASASSTTGEAQIILNAAPTEGAQKIFWDEAAIPGNLTNVKIFLQKTGLEFNELLALLDLKFINPAGDIFVDRPEPSCDTDKMLLQNLDATKLDRIHRFLRLWRKLKGWKMWELDLVIHVLGSGQLNEEFLVQLMRFAEVKKSLGAKVTVEQTASLFGNLNIATRFTKPHEKREDALYQNLFLNRKLINPLDPAFEIDPETNDLRPGQAITDHQSVVQSALGLREADLKVFRELKTTGGQPYITDELNLANLSFLHRHSWMAKTLKFKAEEWVVVLKLLNEDVSEFADPQAAWEFLEKIGRLKNTGFNVDELNWLLAADRSTKAAVKESDAARFLTALRKELKSVQGATAESESVVIQQASAQLGLTEALTRKLFTHYALLPDTLLAHLTGEFAATTGAVDYATMPATFDGWFWANRAAAILKKWKITLEELERLIGLPAGAQMFDFLSLPLNETGAVAPIDRFLRASRLSRLRDSLPETGITLLEILGKLSGGVYADFAADMHRLNDAWLVSDAEHLIASLDIAPADYLLVESWERLARAFRFLDDLNAGAATAQKFAAAAMNNDHARTLKELLRSKFGAETWMSVSAEIQDALRERKRDALVAWLLTQPMPADAPSGKWENSNDIYAYYLLDVEMGSCQMTSRLVQASGSVQLFVQRCFMGLEPEVVVEDGGDQGDSAWRWWKWMRKYRVWEANRKVFLWPENWIEPELKKDRSPFFKDLENELLQNEVNQQNVEAALSNYLEKLGGVAQLEIAGFYQEDDGDETIIHLFGRTPGAEPHSYYYRRYDYRQWTPWEKVDLDIQGEYLIPAVVNKRLFLFWPVFTETPDEAENSTVKVPTPGMTNFTPDKTVKRLRLQMAMSDYRQGRWTPKKVSKDFYESGWITEVNIVRKFYHFVPIDSSALDGRFIIKFGGYSLGSDGLEQAELHGAFELVGCGGELQLTMLPADIRHVIQPEWASVGQYGDRSYTGFMKWIELGSQDEFGKLVNRHDAPHNDFTLDNTFLSPSDSSRYTPVLIQTPWFFRMSPPWHLSYFDKLYLGLQASSSFTKAPRLAASSDPVMQIGSWLPFFYSDKNRTFFVLPSLWNNQAGGGEGGVRQYYPEIKKTYRELEDNYEIEAQAYADNYDLSVLTPAERQEAEQFFWGTFPEEPPPPYTDEQFRGFLKRLFMMFARWGMGAESLQLFESRQFHFKNFYHPFVCDFARLLYNPLKGVPALMSRETQLKNSGFSFNHYYQPTSWVVEEGTEHYHPKEVVDFTPEGAYSIYNWELFFHAPLLIANMLSKNQRFEEARDWYHFIFNPLGVESAAPGGSPMSKYWITKPFFETTDPQYIQQRIDNILRMLAGDTSAPGFSAEAKKALEDQVIDWRNNPFEPHRIANYRAIAYQKTVVMKYLDNLIAWGDYLFRQDSTESVNEATQLYILAAEILGPPPKKIPPRGKPPLESFNELEGKFDLFSNALTQVENLIPALPGGGQNGGDAPPLPMLYFCVPQNEKLSEYWDTVADRLYKIRHCMNIDGVARQLALFEPPIDPAALVKAVAHGVDLGSALTDVDAPLPLYRFNATLQKANEVCGDVKALGVALLAALEKKDAEGLVLLRQGQEIRLLEAVKAVRERQIEEAKENAEGLRRLRNTVEERRNFYRDVEKVSGGEKASMAAHMLGIFSEMGATLLNAAASAAHLTPELNLGVSGLGSPVITARFGGDNLGKSAFNWAAFLGGLGGASHSLANLMAIQAGHDRRWEDWKLQERLAEKELSQIDKQIAAAELRVALAEKELENHNLQIENARALDDFMRSKYTNEELYQWQVGQISNVYFQSYKLAYDLAKRAEKCFRFELGLQDSDYIQFGYWDSLKKGLLSGEKLQYDLRRLENAYMELNRREFELTKHISLALLDPLALAQLRETGRCFIRLPEELFDLDFPGHYFRRIKSVSLTLPCVAGPYTTISCTLRLLKNSVRINAADGDNGYPRNTDEDGFPADDPRFIENSVPVKAIATSGGQNDSGVFELNFRDERYLPFEGAGAVSEWSLELFNDQAFIDPATNQPDFGRPLRQFDYGSISDAILHIKYTAREDSGQFKNAAIAHLREYFSQDGATTSVRLLNLRQEFPTQWRRFLNPTDPAGGNVFELEMAPNLFHFRDKGKNLKINKIWLLARCVGDGEYNVELSSPPLPEPAPSDPDSNKFELATSQQYGGLRFAEKGVEIEIGPSEAPVKWLLTMTGPGSGGVLQKDEVEDLLLVLGYEWESQA